MLKPPLVSFVVTSYNYAKFIEKTLESIKNQTYKNIEIVVVDDCSTDNSIEVIERFINLNQDIRITLIKHDKNHGQFSSMIDGLKICSGQFVSFIDSDDILRPEYAAVHVKIHLSTSVAFTSCQIAEIDENDELHTIYSVSSPHKDEIPEIKVLEDFLKMDTENIKFSHLKAFHFGGWYWSPNSSAMFRKSSISIIKDYKHPQDWRVCPDKFLFNLANLIGGSINISMPLIAYRRHKSNAGGSDYVCGNTRYNNNKTTILNIKNNLKIRFCMFCFLMSAKNEFIAKFGTRGFVAFMLKIWI